MANNPGRKGAVLVAKKSAWLERHILVGSPESEMGQDGSGRR